MMNEQQADRIVEVLRDLGVNAQTSYWAGGIFGVEADTDWVTPDGRTSIQVWVGSDDDGMVAAQFGDLQMGQYSDDYISPPDPLTDEDYAEVAGWTFYLAKKLQKLPEPYDAGLAEVYADIAEAPEAPAERICPNCGTRPAPFAKGALCDDCLPPR